MPCGLYNFDLFKHHTREELTVCALRANAIAAGVDTSFDFHRWCCAARGDFALRFAGVGIILFSPVLLVVFGVCGYVTLRYTLKPLRQVSDCAAAISPQSLPARLQTSGVPTEIEPLVDSFNRHSSGWSRETASSRSFSRPRRTN